VPTAFAVGLKLEAVLSDQFPLVLHAEHFVLQCTLYAGQECESVLVEKFGQLLRPTG
jgi:hypothetical protein